LERETGWQIEGRSVPGLWALLQELESDQELRAKLGPKAVGDMGVALRRYREFRALYEGGDISQSDREIVGLRRPDRFAQLLMQSGFSLTGELKHFYELRKGLVTIYVKRLSNTMPLVVHPGLEEHYTRILGFPGVRGRVTFGYYHNSSMRAFPRRQNNGQNLIAYGLEFDCTDADISRFADALVSFSQGDFEQSDQSPLETHDGAATDPAEETEQSRVQKARIGQGRFRADLVSDWGACPVTGITTPELLRASHIKPWRSSTNSERLDPDNGLLLAVHIDCLFDKGFVSFDAEGAMLISNFLSERERIAIGLSGELPRIKLRAGNLPYLEHHRSEVFLGPARAGAGASAGSAVAELEELIRNISQTGTPVPSGR
jgi:hypothetical protein